MTDEKLRYHSMSPSGKIEHQQRRYQKIYKMGCEQPILLPMRGEQPAVIPVQRENLAALFKHIIQSGTPSDRLLMDEEAYRDFTEWENTIHKGHVVLGLLDQKINGDFPEEPEDDMTPDEPETPDWFMSSFETKDI